MENNRKPPMPGPYYPPFSAGLVGPVSDDVYAAMLDARAQAEAAETAQGKAEDAQEAAETAQGKAEDAQEAAEEAQGKAEDAQEAAETAQAAAESWATGGSSGTPSATNNAKYYSEQAAASAASLELDTTLTEADKAAEAAATGTRIGDIDNAFGVVHTTWEQGRIGTSGQDVAANYSIRTDYIPCAQGDRFLKYNLSGNTYGASFFFYNSGKTYLGSNSSGIAPENAAYMRSTVNLGSGNTILPSAGKNYPILRMPNALSVEIGGRALYTDTGARTININESVSAGDHLFFMPLEWTGTTASEFTLYGYDSGTNTYTPLENVSSVFEFKTHTLSSAYDSLRAGVTSGDTSAGTRFKVLLFKAKTDKISPTLFALGKGIEDLDSEVDTLDGRVDGIDDLIDGKTLPSGGNVNLYDKSTDTTGYTIDETGTIAENQYYEYSALIAVTPGKKYHVYSTAISSASSRLRVHAYDSSEAFIRQVNTKFLASGVGGAMRIDFVAISPYVRIVLRTTNTNTYLGEGGANQPIAVYNDDGTLTYAPLESSALKGKKMSILGASISTFDGYIPSGNSVYYPHETNSDYPVQTVHDTYWQKVLDATGMTLLVNNSSAGSYCSTGHGTSTDAKAGCGDRCEALDDGTSSPDIIIVQLGGNDFTRSTPLGEYDGTQDFPDPSDDPTVTNTFREAYAVMLNKITTKYTGAKVFCGTIPIIRGGTYVTSTFPAKNKDQGAGKPGGILLEAYNDVIRELAKLFGCRVVEFSRCGLTFNNVGTYMQDASGSYGQHPDRRGHSMMANAMLHALGQEFGRVY